MMEEDFWKYAIVALWAIVAVWMAWSWIPATMAAMGKSRYTVQGTNEVADLVPTGQPPDYQHWFDQLESAGFAPLGVARVQILYAASQWRVEAQQRIFHQRESGSYALLERFPPAWEWQSLSLVTLFQDGGVILTVNVAMPEPVAGEHLIRCGRDTSRLTELALYHDALVEREVRDYRRRIDKPESLDMLMAALTQHVGPDLEELFHQQGRSFLIAHAMIHLTVSVPSLWLLGIDHWSIPLANGVVHAMLRLGENMHSRNNRAPQNRSDMTQ